MRIGVIIYHKNIFHYIDSSIVFQCLESINNQTFNDFDVLELDYSKSDKFQTSLMHLGFFKNNKKQTFRKECKNHIQAMNFLLNKAFNELNYDIIFNINLDDIYHERRFEIQLRKTLIEDYSLVGSNYNIIHNKSGNQITKEMIIIREFDNITDEQTYIKIKNNQNKCIIPLSSMCFTKDSWKSIQKIDYLPLLESLLICKKVLGHKQKIHICKEKLLQKRLHDKQVSGKYRN